MAQEVPESHPLAGDRDASRAPSTWRSVGTHLLAGLILLAAGWLQLAGLDRISPTVDEPAHLVSGLAIWNEGDTRLNWGHPPLASALTALPALTAPRGVALSTLPAWEEARTWELAYDYALRDYATYRGQLERARLGAIALTLLLGAYVYVWCRRRFGAAAALSAVVLLLFNPTVLGNGRLVMNDVAIALFIVVAVGEFIRYLERPGWLPVALLGATTGAAFAVKWSAIALVPVFIGFGLHAAWRGTRRFESAGPRARRVGRLAGEVAAAGVVVLLVINASYGFQRSFWSVERTLAHPEPPQFQARDYGGRMLEEESPLPLLPDWLPLPVPYGYVLGAVQIKVHNERGHRSWFMGEPNQHGSVYYFPTLIATKTPLALLVLLIVGVAGWVAHRPRPRPDVALCLVLAALFLALAMSANINIGVRHVMPVIVLMAMLGGIAASREWRGSGLLQVSPLVRRSVVGVLLASAVLSTFGSRPHWLGYFNALAGGRAGGHQISIVAEDMGQDVTDLASDVLRLGLVPLAYAPYYPAQAAELNFHGIGFLSFNCGAPADKIEGHWVAVHAALLRRVAHCYPWADGMEPVHHVNHHILVFDLRAGAGG